MGELRAAVYSGGFEQGARVDVSGWASLEPDDLTCQFARIRCWMPGRSAASEKKPTEFDTQVATWEAPSSGDHRALAVVFNNAGGSETHHLPLVWDENSWNGQLAVRDSWPDLQRCVELYFLANPGLRDYPVSEWTDGFWKSVGDFCEPKMRGLLVKAIAKRVYSGRTPRRTLGGNSTVQSHPFLAGPLSSLTQHCLEEFGEHDIGL